MSEVQGTTVLSNLDTHIGDKVKAKFQVCEVNDTDVCSEFIETKELEVGNENTHPYVENFDFIQDLYNTDEDISLVYDFRDINLDNIEDEDQRKITFYKKSSGDPSYQEVFSGSSIILPSSYTQK
ncbi:MAG: hypothetical protein U9Q15_02985 [Patescibacteria group bacterium]|nr:hypothetical protein [Patescibacteria group bacterium]